MYLAKKKHAVGLLYTAPYDLRFGNPEWTMSVCIDLFKRTLASTERGRNLWESTASTASTATFPT